MYGREAISIFYSFILLLFLKSKINFNNKIKTENGTKKNIIEKKTQPTLIYPSISKK